MSVKGAPKKASSKTNSMSCLTKVKEIVKMLLYTWKLLFTTGKNLQISVRLSPSSASRGSFIAAVSTSLDIGTSAWRQVRQKEVSFLGSAARRQICRQMQLRDHHLAVIDYSCFLRQWSYATVGIIRGRFNEWLLVWSDVNLVLPASRIWLQAFLRDKTTKVGDS